MSKKRTRSSGGAAGEKPAQDLPRTPGNPGAPTGVAVGWIILACIVLALLGCFVVAGGPGGFAGRLDYGVMALSVVFVDGAAAALMLLSACGVGLMLLRPFSLHVGPLMHWTTAIALGFGVQSLLVLGLGLAGLLSMVAAYAVLLVGLGLLVWRIIMAKPTFSADDSPRQIEGDAAFKRLMPGVHWLWVLPSFLLGYAAFCAALPPHMMWWPDDPHPYDVLAYHLQVPREWMETGRIEPLAHNVYSYFPFLAEMQFLQAMLLRGHAWHAIYQSQMLMLGCGVVLVMAVYAVARELGVGSTGACIAAAFVGLTPWTVMLSVVTYVEAPLMLCCGLSIGWALKAMRSTRWHDWAIAGVMAGLACGVKYTAVPMLLVALPACIALINATRFNAWKGAAIFGVAGLLAFSPWLIRNAVWSGGNPVYPLAMSTLGAGDFSDKQVERWDAAHQAPAEIASPTGRLHRLATEFAGIPETREDGALKAGGAWKFGYVLLPCALLGVALGRNRDVAIIGALIAAQLIIWATSTHLVGRFLAMLVPSLGLLVGFAVERLKKAPAIALAAPAIIHGLLAASMLFGVIDARLSPTPNINLRAAVGLTQLSHPAFYDPRLTDAYASGKKVVVIGEANVFMHPFPAERMFYTSVFNLPADASNVLEAYVSEHDRTQLSDDDLIVIQHSELRRFAESYRHVPRMRPRGEAGQYEIIRWGDRDRRNWAPPTARNQSPSSGQ